MTVAVSSNVGGREAVRLVRKDSPLWRVVKKYNTAADQASRTTERDRFLSVLRDAVVIAKIVRGGELLPPHIEAYRRLMAEGIAPEFLQTDNPLLVTRMQAEVLTGTFRPRKPDANLRGVDSISFARSWVEHFVESEVAHLPPPQFR